MLYIDTSVLLVYTLTQSLEPDRYPATAVFFSRIRQRYAIAIQGWISVYAG